MIVIFPVIWLIQLILLILSVFCWIRTVSRLSEIKGVGHGILAVLFPLYPFFWIVAHGEAFGLAREKLWWIRCWIGGFVNVGSGLVLMNLL